VRFWVLRDDDRRTGMFYQLDPGGMAALSPEGIYSDVKDLPLEESL
jgi:hypothetical protein